MREELSIDVVEEGGVGGRLSEVRVDVEFHELLKTEDCGGGVRDRAEFAEERGDELGKGAGDFFFRAAFGFSLLEELDKNTDYRDK